MNGLWRYLFLQKDCSEDVTIVSGGAFMKRYVIPISFILVFIIPNLFLIELNNDTNTESIPIIMFNENEDVMQRFWLMMEV